MSDNLQQHREPKRRGRGCLFVLLACTPMVYILSWPFVFLLVCCLEELTGVDLYELHMSFYAPVQSLCDASESFNSLYRRYWEVLSESWF